jgi:hypothetical protein
MMMLSLFDKTGNMARPWAEAGHETLCVDIEHSIRAPKAGTLNCDLSSVGPLLMALADRGHKLSDIAFLACFPPCTDVAVSGARDFQLKGLRRLAASISFFATCQEIASLVRCPWMIENPVSTMSTYWRKPDHVFHPADYTGFEMGDNYTKKTCLWTGNGFVMPEANRLPGLPPSDDRIHKAAPGNGRAGMRSATPMGFARAVFEANRVRQSDG